jgi:hypothetical protein
MAKTGPCFSLRQAQMNTPFERGFFNCAIPFRSDMTDFLKDNIQVRVQLGINSAFGETLGIPA